MPNISDFKAQFNDFLRAPHFEMWVFPPPMMGAGTDTTPLKFLCYEVTTPNWTVNATQEEIASVVFKKASRADFDNVSVSFYLDDKMFAYDFFYQWISKIHDTKTGIAEYFEEYAAPTAAITILNNRKEPVGKITLYDVYPSQLSGLPLNWQSSDTLLTGTVSLTFRRFEFEMADGSGKKQTKAQQQQNILNAGAAAYGFKLGD